MANSSNFASIFRVRSTELGLNSEHQTIVDQGIGLGDFQGQLKLCNSKRAAITARLTQLDQASNQRQKKLDPKKAILELSNEIPSLEVQIGLQENAYMPNVISQYEKIDSEYSPKLDDANQRLNAIISQLDKELQTTLSNIYQEFAQALAV